MNLSQLNPLPVEVAFGVDVLRLRPFDLNAVVWAEDYFSNGSGGGLNKMNAILKNPDDWPSYSSAIAVITHYLFEDRDIVEVLFPTLCVFSRKINEFPKKDGGSSGLIARFHFALEKVFFNSFVQPEVEEETVGGHQKEEEKETEQNWEAVFTRIAGKIGCDLDRFYRYTMKQITAFNSEILIQENKDFKILAALHGMQMKNGYQKPAKKYPKITDEEKTAALNTHNKMMKLFENANPS